MLLIGAIILIISVIAHEVAHGYAANALGDPTARLAGRLTPNPLVHIDPVGSVVLPVLLLFTHSPILFGWAKPVPYNPHNLRHGQWGEAVVALAGSATNLFLGIAFALVVRYGGMMGIPESAVAIASLISFTNLFLGFFNLIPFPPLDGFTALRTIAPHHLSFQLSNLEQRLSSLGLTALIFFLILFSSVFSLPFARFVDSVSRFFIGS